MLLYILCKPDAPGSFSLPSGGMLKASKMRKLFLQAKHQQNPVAADLCWGAAGFYVVGIPGLFWGVNTWHCFGLTCEDSKLKPSPRCNQRNQAHLKLFKHILFPPGETCLPWLTSYPRQACLGALLIPLTPSAAACGLFVLLLWFPPGDTLKQLLGSDSAVIFLCYSPQRTTKEAISPALVGRKCTLFFSLLRMHSWCHEFCGSHLCVYTFWVHWQLWTPVTQSP